jgi:hypothetical protein
MGRPEFTGEILASKLLHLNIDVAMETFTVHIHGRTQ